MAELATYSAEPELSRPRRFLARSLRDLARAAAPARALFLASLRADHRRSWLLYLWLFVPAAGMAAMCSFVLSRRIVSVAPTELPYPVFVLAGMVLWQSFIDGVNAPLQHLARSRQLISRSALPHEAVIGAGLLHAALNAATRLVILAVVLVLLPVPLAAGAFLFPLGLAAVLLFGFAIGLLAAPVGLLYDDVARAIFLFSAFLFFVTPVAYPLPAEGWFALNPMALLLGTARGWLTGGGTPGAFLLLVAAIPVLIALAWLLYRLSRPHVLARLG
jgi:lipopolysaccharide transport system permease protein